VTLVAPLPLPVTGTVTVDEDAQQPFQKELCYAVPPQTGCGTLPSQFTTGADGLIIEQLSGLCLVRGVDRLSATLSTTAGGSEARHQLVLHSGFGQRDVAQQMTIRADPNTAVVLGTLVEGFEGDDVAACRITVSGYSVAE
jgi:hypothetical protein